MARTIIHAVTKDGQAVAIERYHSPLRTRMYRVRVEGAKRAVKVSRACLKLALRAGTRVLGRLQTWE